MVTHFKPSVRLPVDTLRALELMPGDVVLGEVGDQFKTLLGSCVSVILCDPRRTIAAMCHVVFTGKPKAEHSASTAYGSAAMESMFARLREKGVNPLLCQAYVFGGGNMFPQFFSPKHVGASNSEWVLNFLHDHNIHVLDQCIGGNGYRKISWTVGSGKPLVETVFLEQSTTHGR
jgi:chemotaxis protein CheD